MTSASNGHPRDRLSEYLDDALEIDEREKVDRHLAECEDCRAELDALWYLASAVAAEKVPPVPSALAAQISRRLDHATVARPRFRRFLVPASIAATIGAVGLLVALQWREGRLSVPSAPERSQRAKEARAFDDQTSADAPSTPTAGEGKLSPQSEPAGAMEPAPLDSLQKEVRSSEQPQIDERLQDKKSEAAPSSVAGAVERGVVGGVAGGVPGGVDNGVADGGSRASESDARQRAAVDDARRDAAKSREESESVSVKSKQSAPFAPAPAMAPSLSKGNAAGESPCMDRWSDSGVRGSWDVPDIDAAMRQLGRVAHAVGGIGFWRGVTEGRPYVVVVPRVHFEEVFYALRARGVSGLTEAPTLAEGTDCTGISVTLRLVPDPQATPGQGR